MDVAIMSFTSSKNNYGQLLQCFALQAALRKLGHEARHIRYYPERRVAPGGFSVVEMAKMVKSRLNVRYLVDKARGIIKRDFPDERRDFNSFIDKHVQTYPKVYRSIAELRDDPPHADVFVAGSDQIWGMPVYDANTEGWFLKFGGNDVRRVSYAASIGHPVRREELPRFSELLLGLDCVGVREEGVRRVCGSCGVDSCVVLDPTLLLTADDYRTELNLKKPVKRSDPYLFAYILNVLYKKDIHYRQLEAYAHQHSLDIIPVYSSGYYSQYPIIPRFSAHYPTIPQWLELIEGANAVVTTSFHGVVFSILFERPFVALPLPGRGGNGADRISTLLSSLHLEDRQYVAGVPLEAQMDSPIDWLMVRERLEDARGKSLAFLRDSLSGN